MNIAEQIERLERDKIQIDNRLFVLIEKQKQALNVALGTLKSAISSHKDWAEPKDTLISSVNVLISAVESLKQIHSFHGHVDYVVNELKYVLDRYEEQNRLIKEIQKLSEDIKELDVHIKRHDGIMKNEYIKITSDLKEKSTRLTRNRNDLIGQAQSIQNSNLNGKILNITHSIGLIVNALAQAEVFAAEDSKRTQSMM